MLTLEDLKKDRALINSIDWDMTPEMAVRLYMEWGNVWSDRDKGYVVRSKNDSSVFFLVNCWENPHSVSLVKSNCRGAEDLAKFGVPEQYAKIACRHQQSHAPEGELKDWLKKELNVN